MDGAASIDDFKPCDDIEGLGGGTTCERWACLPGKGGGGPTVMAGAGSRLSGRSLEFDFMAKRVALSFSGGFDGLNGGREGSCEGSYSGARIVYNCCPPLLFDTAEPNEYADISEVIVETDSLEPRLCRLVEDLRGGKAGDLRGGRAGDVRGGRAGDCPELLLGGGLGGRAGDILGTGSGVSSIG